MSFTHVNFIRAPQWFSPSKPGPATMFRRKFRICGPIESATVHVCGLGYGYTWLNGIPISEDLFTAAPSDYRKTLWYHSYDVTAQLKPGENVFAAFCGNGWYNEHIETTWKQYLAPWRDNPKYILSLEVNGTQVLTTDGRWKCTTDTPVLFDQLRSGEHFDARKYDPSWTGADFDDSSWEFAANDCTPPTGVFRPCLCEPIRVDRVYPAISLTHMGGDRYVFDFGQNMSGFIRLHVDQHAGDELVIRYGEELQENGELEHNQMGIHYPASQCQTDRLICPEGPFTWSPRFTYHGFRYAEITGIQNPTLDSASGVFVHQAVAARTAFRCSDPNLNELFRIGRMATLSNMFYIPTDCSTREKMGWCNDVQSSAEQFLTNFHSEKFLAKWLQDIYDAMLPGGQLPSIIPTGGWGYAWGHGPVCEGVLYEVPYRLYLHTGDKSYLVNSLPYFKQNLAALEACLDEKGDMRHGLDDWAPPDWEDMVTAPFLNSALMIKFYQITALAAKLAGQDCSPYAEKAARQIAMHKAKYLLPDGTCAIHKQTAVAMLLCQDIYEDSAPLKAQLIRLVEEKNFHHDCGMVGLPYLFRALNKLGLQEYAYRILTAKGFPGYFYWLEHGATTLYEQWNLTDSKNHHMYSDFMSWMMKTVIGIRLTEPGYAAISIEPYFFEALSWAEGHLDTPHGRVRVRWERKPEGICLALTVPEGLTAVYAGQVLSPGDHSICL